MRMATVVANLLAPFCKGRQQTPDLIWPYVTTTEDLAEEARKVLSKAKELYGEKSREHGDSPWARLQGHDDGGGSGREHAKSP